MMNEVLKAIASRRSVRRFKADQLDRKDLEAIVEAGLCAPSANNAQDCNFTVVQDPEMIAKIDEWIREEIERSGTASLKDLARKEGGIFRGAPTVVVLSTERGAQSGVANAAAAAENMLIAAESLGISSCWIGMLAVLSKSLRADSYARELCLPGGYAPQTGITLGYRESAVPPPPPRRPDRVSYIE